VAKPPTPLWYKEAIVYQLHIKTFCDANDGGIGDFQGLLSKLDYLKNIGVTAIWLFTVLPAAAQGRWVRYRRLFQRESCVRNVG